MVLSCSSSLNYTVPVSFNVPADELQEWRSSATLSIGTWETGVVDLGWRYSLH